MASFLRAAAKAVFSASSATTTAKRMMNPTTAAALGRFTVPAMVFEQKRFAHLAHSHYLPREEIEARVMELLGSYPRIPKDKLSTTSHLVSDLGLDSLDCVEVIIEMEEEFQVQINDDDAAHLVTVNDIIDYFAHLPFVE